MTEIKQQAKKIICKNCENNPVSCTCQRIEDFIHGYSESQKETQKIIDRVKKELPTWQVNKIFGDYKQ